jgi:hypothetical protein
MATQYTPEEIAEIFEAYNNAIKTGTPISAELAKQMQDASKGFKGATDELNKFAKSIGTSAAQFTKSMYEGKQGLNAMGGAVDGVGTALEFLIGLIPGARLLKIGLTLLTKATVGATKVLSEQSDKLFKTYQDLSKVGAAAAGGMTDVFNSMQKLGYGIEELDKMTALIKENAEALSNFGGTVAQGAKQFANAAGEIQRSDVGKSLQMLGKTPDEINRGVALFVKQQQQSGVSSANINKNLADQSAAYIKNLDVLSKLTGKDADALQAKLDDAMAEDAFNQTIYELKKKAAAGDIEAGKLATEYENAARRLTGESLKEFQRGVGGDISAMTKSMMVSSDAVATIGTKAFTASGYIDKMAKGADQARDTLGGLYKLNALGDVLPSAKELSVMQSRYADQTAQNQEEQAKAQQELQQKGLDPATKAAVELRISQMQARDSLQSFVQLGVEPATRALATLARAGAGGAGMLPGGGGKAPMGGGGSGQMDYGKELYGKSGGGGGGAGGGAGGGVASLGNLRIKSPEAYSGGETSQQLITVAQAIQDKLGGDLKNFSAFNDSYHRGPNSLHGKGRALDFTITDPKKAAAVADMVRSLPGISKVIDEYANPSGHATAPHIHAEISAANGAILSGPTSGYKPNLTMHGTEAIVPLNSPAAQSAFGNSDQTNLMSAQLDKLDELVRVMQNQVSVSTKILQAAN